MAAPMLYARDARYGMASSVKISSAGMVHTAAAATRAPAPLAAPGAQASRQTSPGFMKAQSARVLSGTPQYHGALITRQPQVFHKPPSQAELERSAPIAPVCPPPPADGKFGSQGPAPLPFKWSDEFEVASETPVLGGGAFAEVFKVRHRQSGQHFAVKVMHRPNFTLRGIEKQIENEIKAMVWAAKDADETGVDNYIVRLIDFVEEGEYVFLMLELCEQGDLLRKLYQQPGQRFTEALALVWSRQLLEGLAVLHRLGVIHRDIKPDNLLCTDQGILKIADFGWCSETRDAPTALAGTFQYMAPEVLQNHPQTEKADVWSTGVTLYQLLVGKPLLNTYLGPGATNLSARDPHEATAVKQRWLVEEIKATCPPSPDLCPQDISSLCWDFLRRLLVPEVNARATVAEALQHPWLQFDQKEGPLTIVSEAGSVQISRAGSAAAASAVDCIEEARESDEEENSTAGPEVVLTMASPLRKSSGKEVTISLAKPPPALGSPIKTITPQGLEVRSPFSDRTDESMENVPTPLNPRTWDPNRNMAYSPPINKSNTEDLGSSSFSPAQEAGNRSPERSPEQPGSPERRQLDTEHVAEGDPVAADARNLPSTPGRDLDRTPREQLLPPPALVASAPAGAMAAAAMKAAGLDPLLNTRQASPSGGRQTPLPPSPMLTAVPVQTVPLVKAPFPRLSPQCAGGRSVSPSGGGRTSLGSPLRYTAGRRPLGVGGVHPTISAPRLRLSAPGDLIGGSVPAGALSTGAIPQLGGSAGPLSSSPHRRPGLGISDNAGSLRWKPRPDTAVDPHALLTELHNTNENLRMAFVQLVSNMGKPGATASATVPSNSNIERVVRDDIAMSAAFLEPFLPPGHGAASAPVASPALQMSDMQLDDVAPISPLESAIEAPSYDDVNGGVLDILSATAPPAPFCGASTPNILAPVHTARDGQAMLPQQMRTGSGGGIRVTSARGRENYLPGNQCLADAKQAWAALAGKTPSAIKNRETIAGGSNPRQAGSVQVRQGSMSRYGACSGGQALASQPHLDVLSQTAHSTVITNVVPPSTLRECRTPLVPNWPRAASPDTRCSALSTLQPHQVKPGQGPTALPPPRLVANQPPRSGTNATTLPTRLTATPTHGTAGGPHLWAYSAGAGTVYRGPDERRRASVGGGAYYPRV